MSFKFPRPEPKNKLREVRYTHSWLEYVGAPVLRVMTGYIGFGAGTYGAPLPTAEELAAGPRIPRVVWWRTAARAGVETAEEFANSGVRLPPSP